MNYGMMDVFTNHLSQQSKMLPPPPSPPSMMNADQAQRQMSATASSKEAPLNAVVTTGSETSSVMVTQVPSLSLLPKAQTAVSLSNGNHDHDTSSKNGNGEGVCPATLGNGFINMEKTTTPIVIHPYHGESNNNEISSEAKVSDGGQRSLSLVEVGLNHNNDDNALAPMQHNGGVAGVNVQLFVTLIDMFNKRDDRREKEREEREERREAERKAERIEERREMKEFVNSVIAGFNNESKTIKEMMGKYTAQTDAYMIEGNKLFHLYLHTMFDGKLYHKIDKNVIRGISETGTKNGRPKYEYDVKKSLIVMNMPLVNEMVNLFIDVYNNSLVDGKHMYNEPRHTRLITLNQISNWRRQTKAEKAFIGEQVNQFEFTSDYVKKNLFVFEYDAVKKVYDDLQRNTPITLGTSTIYSNEGTKQRATRVIKEINQFYLNVRTVFFYDRDKQDKDNEEDESDETSDDEEEDEDSSNKMRNNGFPGPQIVHVQRKFQRRQTVGGKRPAFKRPMSSLLSAATSSAIKEPAKKKRNIQKQ